MAGHFLLTRLLQEKKLLRRVIHVTSTMHFLGSLPETKEELAVRFHKRNYCDTKLMNNLFSNKLAREGAMSVLVHPGLVDTDIFRNRPAMKKFLSMLTSTSTFSDFR